MSFWEIYRTLVIALGGVVVIWFLMRWAINELDRRLNFLRRASAGEIAFAIILLQAFLLFVSAGMAES